jgi:hypothetical protein
MCGVLNLFARVLNGMGILLVIHMQQLAVDEREVLGAAHA